MTPVEVFPLLDTPTRRTVLLGIIGQFAAFDQWALCCLNSIPRTSKPGRVAADRVPFRLATHDQAITGIIKTIRELMNPPEPKKRSIGFVELEEKK